MRAAIFILALTILVSDPWPLSAQTEMETPGTTPIALVEEAYLAHRRGSYTEAIEGYSQIIRRRGLTKRERAITYLLRGEAKRDAGQLEEAAVDFTRALGQWPGYPQAHFFRGRVYEKQGRLLEAYADIFRAAELEPNREAYETSLAVLRLRMEKEGVTPPSDSSPLEPTAPEVPPDSQ